MDVIDAFLENLLERKEKEFFFVSAFYTHTHTMYPDKGTSGYLIHLCSIIKPKRHTKNNPHQVYILECYSSGPFFPPLFV